MTLPDPPPSYGPKPAFAEKKGIFDRKLADRPERFDDFTPWQEARRLTNRLYEITAKPELEADTNLRDELRRAAVAAMTHLAEGVEAAGEKEFLRGLSQGKSAAGAVRSLVFVGVDRGYFDEKEAIELQGRSTALGRMLASQIARLKRAETTDVKKKDAKRSFGPSKGPPRQGGYGKRP